MLSTISSIFYYFILFPNFLYCNKVFWYQPEQIHLSYGSNIREYLVTWSTFNKTPESIVEYGIGNIILQAFGSAIKFVDGGPAHHTQYIHSVLLTNLTAGKVYTYHCGSSKGWSDRYWFKTPPRENEWQPSIALFGDMGNENAQSLARLQEETQRGMYDAIFHIGDFAYDMNSENALIGDQFMRQIEPIASYVPYMTCPGNHEEKYNFSNYRYRFNMPGSKDSLMYTFDMGPAHFISISTEVYYFLNYGIKPLVFQYEWLEERLIEANKPKNRKKRPWIIVMGHRPMYCSNDNTDDCTHHATMTRVGLPFLRLFPLEKLLYDYGVDVEIWAHEHSYERLWPIYNYKVYNGSYYAPYYNPRAPVHIVTGSAGCREGRDTFNGTRPEWSAFQSNDYGFTRLKIINSTLLYFEQVSTDKQGAVIDSFWIFKEYHGPYRNFKKKGKYVTYDGSSSRSMH